MRRGAVGLAASLGLALALSWAPAALAAHGPKGREGELPARVAGAVTIAWHGDPARGCAAAGVCDVGGSLVYTPSDANFNVIKLPNGKFFPGEIEIGDIGSVAVVRVRRDPPGGAPSLCVDTVDAPFELLTATPINAGRYRFDFSDQTLDGNALSSGRCAGPLPQDLRAAMPSGVLDMNALRQRSALMNMSSRRPIAFGPYSGQVISTMGIRVLPFSDFDRGSGVFFSETFGGGSGSHHKHRVRVLEIAAKYRIASMSGTLVTNFTGVDGPLCATLDACGASGTIDYNTSVTGGELIMGGARRLRRGERPTLRSALRELRAGRLAIGGFGSTRPDAAAKVSGTFSRPGDATCSDTTTAVIPPLDLFGGGRAMQFRMDLPNEQVIEELRTRCPGPTETETLARGSLAAGRLPLATLGARSLRVTMSRPGTFASGAYAGTRSGSLELQLVRTAIKEKVSRIPVSEAP